MQAFCKWLSYEVSVASTLEDADERSTSRECWTLNTIDLTLGFWSKYNNLPLGFHSRYNMIYLFTLVVLQVCITCMSDQAPWEARRKIHKPRLTSWKKFTITKFINTTCIASKSCLEVICNCWEVCVNKFSRGRSLKSSLSYTRDPLFHPLDISLIPNFLFRCRMYIACLGCAIPG